MTKKELVFVGPPASGKGTQTKKLAADTHLVHVDTGSLLREVIASGSETGKVAKGFIDKGQLVPVELVAKVIKERLSLDDCKQGFILDGYPRSLEQALLLDDILKELDRGADSQLKVIYFNIPIDELMDRIVYRRSCPKCGAIFNLKTMPLETFTNHLKLCNCCESELTQRKDDTEEIAKLRFETYFEQTAPLVEFYKKRGILVEINANEDVEKVYENLKEAINK